MKLKNIAIYIGSRKDDFVSFNTKDGGVYALADQYPERKRELEKVAKGKGSGIEVVESVDNSKKE